MRHTTGAACQRDVKNVSKIEESVLRCARRPRRASVANLGVVPKQQSTALSRNGFPRVRDDLSQDRGLQSHD